VRQANLKYLGGSANANPPYVELLRQPSNRVMFTYMHDQRFKLYSYAAEVGRGVGENSVCGVYTC